MRTHYWIAGLLLLAGCGDSPQTIKNLNECRSSLFVTETIRDGLRDEVDRLRQPPKLDVLREPLAKFICLARLAGEDKDAQLHFQLNFNDDPSLALGYLEGRSNAILANHPEFADKCEKKVVGDYKDIGDGQ